MYLNKYSSIIYTIIVTESDDVFIEICAIIYISKSKPYKFMCTFLHFQTIFNSLSSVSLFTDNNTVCCAIRLNIDIVKIYN